MRCPKCGYVSFDNVDTCLKCKKDISEISAAFQGTTFNVTAPAFLKFSDHEDDPEGQADAADGGDSEVEFADPDLEILVDEDEDREIEFSMDDGEDDFEASDAALAEEFGVMETVGEDGEVADSESSLDLGMFEDGSEEDSFGFEDSDDTDSGKDVSLDLPEELSDISDLSPPGTTGTEETLSFEEELPETADSDDDMFGDMGLSGDEVAPAGQAPEDDLEDDLDFGSLDMDLSFDDDEAEESDFSEPALSPAAPEKAVAGMDDDLNLDLDLGGLSIHDER